MKRKQLFAGLVAVLVAAGPASAENWSATYWPELDLYGQPVCQLWGTTHSSTLTLTATGGGTYFEFSAYSLSNTNYGDVAILRFSDSTALQLTRFDKPDRYWISAYLDAEETLTILNGVENGTEIAVEVGADSIMIPTETAHYAVTDFRICLDELTRVFQWEEIPR